MLWIGVGRAIPVAPDEASFLRQLASGLSWRGGAWAPSVPDPERGFADWVAVREIVGDALGQNAQPPEAVTALTDALHPALAGWLSAGDSEQQRWQSA